MSGRLDYESKTAPVPRSGLSLLAKLTAAVAAIAFIASLLLPALNRPRDHPQWVRCASNLKQIGQAILLYANENRDHAPPDFVALLQTQDLAPEVLVCGSTTDERTTATQPADQRADLAAGGHCSYVYVDGQEPVSKASALDVVAFEPPGHHDDICNVLFGDGHVDQVTDAMATDLQRQHASGVRPIRLPTR